MTLAQARPFAQRPLPFEVKGMDDSARTFTGIAAAFTQDLGGDVILPGAFKRTLKDWKSSKGRVVPLLDSHNRMTVRAVIGKMEEAEETAAGLEATFSVIDGPDGDEVWRRVKAGLVDGLSIGYRAIQTKEPGPEEQRAGIWRYLQEIKVEEVSAVIFGMNPDARIDGRSVKSLLALDAADLSPGDREELLVLDQKLRALLSPAPASGHPEPGAGGLAPEDLRRRNMESALRALTLRGLGA